MSFGDAPIKKEGGVYLQWNVTLSNFLNGDSVEDVGGEDELRRDALDFITSLRSS